MAQEVTSPCDKTCAIDEQRGWCRGCWRTLEEIARWTEYSNVEKLAVIKRTAKRKAANGDES